MSRFLLDTKVISEIVRPRRSANVVKWIEAADESILHISVLTLGEIPKGIALLSDGRRRMSVESWFDKDLAHRFSGRILSIDRALQNVGEEYPLMRRPQGLPCCSSIACSPRLPCSTISSSQAEMRRIREWRDWSCSIRGSREWASGLGIDGQRMLKLRMIPRTIRMRFHPFLKN